MKKIRINANAKINLFLEVGARRADGYHDIESVMQSVTLCDTVTVCAGEEVPEGNPAPGGADLCAAAAQAGGADREMTAETG